MSKDKDQVETPENENENNEETTETLYDAVSSAIDEVTPETDDDNDDTNEPTDTGDESEVPAGGDTPAPETEGDTEEPAEGSETDEDKSADDGEGDSTESGDETEGEDDGDGDKPKEGDDLAEDPDPVNDPIPESTNEKTKARIESLIGIIKDKESAEVQRDEIVDQIVSTGAQPEQYAATLGFLKLYNSTNTEERKQALTVARGLVKELALELNEGTTVVNLDDHADLLAEIEAGTLTEARAKEIAANRDAEALRTSKQTAANERKETDSQTKTNVKKGVTQLDAFETAMRADVNENYDVVRPAFIRVLRPALKRSHPSEWGEVAREVYEQIKTLSVTAQTKPKPKPKNQPLRPTGGGGGGATKTAEAGSAVEALDAALDNLG
jgi:hypothetical protein